MIHLIGRIVLYVGTPKPDRQNLTSHAYGVGRTAKGSTFADHRGNAAIVHANDRDPLRDQWMIWIEDNDQDDGKECFVLDLAIIPVEVTTLSFVSVTRSPSTPAGAEKSQSTRFEIAAGESNVSVHINYCHQLTLARTDLGWKITTNDNRINTLAAFTS
jgi:hypothetical protein